MLGGLHVLLLQLLLLLLVDGGSNLRRLLLWCGLHLMLLLVLDVYGGGLEGLRVAQRCLLLCLDGVRCRTMRGWCWVWWRRRLGWRRCQ